jgi:phosphoribosylaminoimidazolecarboxamide formyltransferase/IMP cyclohydrolase
MPNPKIKSALISVSDKSGLIPFAKNLRKHGVKIISTGGTLKALNDAKISAIAIDQVTGFPEIMEGRVKTLHPKVHGGLLYRRDKKLHRDQAKQHGIEAIDLVVVNLYPFEQVTQDKKVKLEVAIENIDIGGPSMLRSAAKNAESVTVVCDPKDYEAVIEEMKQNKGATTKDLRFKLAVKVFERTSNYDGAIFNFLKGKIKSQEKSDHLPDVFSSNLQKVNDLRYGENPHQRAAIYVEKGTETPKHFKQLHGKELSYNNMLDIDATLDIIREFDAPAACVIKHTNPCGIAEASTVERAIQDAVDSDPLSAFGGIVAINRPCTLKSAKTIFEKLNFFEVLIAPSFDKASLTYLKKRKNLRIIESEKASSEIRFDKRYLKNGGVLIQDEDAVLAKTLKEMKKNLKVVTKKKATDKDLTDLIFAFKCVKVVKSNAIVLTQGRKTVGIGAGQMSRVDSVAIACRKAGDRTKGSLLASDAFFPMPDSIEIAHEHGIKAIIQPGGSIRDSDVVEACDKHGIVMILTGKRHFKH